MAKNKILRVGVLGQGRSGYAMHVRWFREARDQYKVVAVSDEMPERLKEAREEFGARTYTDYKKLLKDKSLGLDLVVNAMPSFLHPKGTIDALNAGHNVVCEKPLAKTVKDYDKMVAVARRNKKLLLPFQNSRFLPYFQKIQEVIASGKLGKIIYIRSNWSGFARRWDWQTLQEFWGGNLLNTGSHPIDHAIVLFGDKNPKVFSRMVSENPFGDADNFTIVVLYGKDSPTIEVVLNSFQTYPQGESYNISGTCGGLTGEGAGLKWKYFNPVKSPTPQNTGKWSSNRTYCSEQLEWIEESWAPPKTEYDGIQFNSKAFYDNVYDIMVNKGKRIITLDQVRRQIEVMEECYRQNHLQRLKTKFRKK